MLFQACNLAANIFTNAKEHVRMGMLNDILNSLHRLPAGRNASNSYRFGSEQWISNTTVLVLQLLQSVVRVGFQPFKCLIRSLSKFYTHSL